MEARIIVLLKQNGSVTVLFPRIPFERSFDGIFLFGVRVKCQHSMLNSHCSLTSVCKRAVSHCGCTSLPRPDAASTGRKKKYNVSKYSVFAFLKASATC